MPVKIDIPDEDLYLMDQEDRQERTIHHSDNIACAIQLTDDDEHPQRTESAMFGTSLINTINDTPYTALKEIWKISIGCILQYSPIITAHFVLLLFAIHRDDQFPSDMLVLDAVDTEYYQLFTYALVHNSESHLYANVAVLFVTGWVTEVSYGRLTLVLLMGISAGGGGIFFRFSHMVFEGASLVAGASGIVYGLVTFGIVQSFLRRPFPLDAKKIAFYAYGAILLLLLVLEVATFFMSNQSDNKQRNETAHSAHLGGAISGLFFVIVVRNLDKVCGQQEVEEDEREHQRPPLHGGEEQQVHPRIQAGHQVPPQRKVADAHRRLPRIQIEL